MDAVNIDRLRAFKNCTLKRPVRYPSKYENNAPPQKPKYKNDTMLWRAFGPPMSPEVEK